MEERKGNIIEEPGEVRSRNISSFLQEPVTEICH